MLQVNEKVEARQINIQIKGSQVHDMGELRELKVDSQLVRFTNIRYVVSSVRTESGDEVSTGWGWHGAVVFVCLLLL